MRRKWLHAIMLNIALVFLGCSGFTTILGEENCESDYASSLVPVAPAIGLDSAFDAAERHAVYPILVTVDSLDVSSGTIELDCGTDEYTWIEGWFGTQTKKITYSFQGDSLLLTFTRIDDVGVDAENAEERSFVFVGGVPGQLEGTWKSADYDSIYIRFGQMIMSIAF